jgi:hypothetical protein
MTTKEDAMSTEYHREAVSMYANPIPDGARYTLDGTEVDVEIFIGENEDFEVADINQISALNVGEQITYGGGAAPERVLRRIA